MLHNTDPLLACLGHAGGTSCCPPKPWLTSTTFENVALVQMARGSRWQEHALKPLQAARPVSRRPINLQELAVAGAALDKGRSEKDLEHEHEHFRSLILRQGCRSLKVVGGNC